MVLRFFNFTDDTAGTDILELLPNTTFEASRKDISGPNTGTAIDSTTIRDVIGIKHEFKITTRAIPMITAVSLESKYLLKADGFYLMTDYFSANTLIEATEVFTVYADSVQINYAGQSGAKDYVVLSAVLKEF